MENKETRVLKELLQSFDQKHFDLEVWKIKATLVIKKIFGESDGKLQLIEALHYDYSSWSLRDKTGMNQPDTVREQARGIIEAALIELSLSASDDDVLSELQQQLSGSEMEQLQQFIQQSNVNEEVLLEYFSKIAPLTKDRVLSRLILKKL